MSNSINGIDTFKELYTDYFQAVWGFCSTYLKDSEQAMDATQETFFKLYERLDNSYTKQNAIAFIYIMDSLTKRLPPSSNTIHSNI